MENRIKLKITTISSSNPVNVIKGEGVFRQKDGKTLVTHQDSDGNKTSFIITDGRILLTRKSPFYQLKIPVTKGEKLHGIMGEESVFTVIGKEACFEVDKKCGRIYVEYTLPDLSDEVTDFKIDAEFEFLKGN